jgi:ABC-2 type transport system ATP-binding protein
VLHELTPRAGTLEEAFMELTADSLEFGQHGGQPAAAGSAGGGPPVTAGSQPRPAAGRHSR